MPGTELERVDVAVVGAGIAGLYAIHRIERLGLTVRCLEEGSDVGGTWYWNRYPGARCDVESLEYSYQFDAALQDEWRWQSRYASQEELHHYLRHVADRFELRRHILFNERVTELSFQENSTRWRVGTETGLGVEARHVVMATGCLSAANVPPIPGSEEFEGLAVHTARWPADGLPVEGRTVGVIGTGSSAVQAIPRLAVDAAELIVFQRTPAYVVPAHSGPIDPSFESLVRSDYAAFRARNSTRPRAFASHVPGPESSALEVSDDERDRAFQERWDFGGLTFIATFTDLMTDQAANELAQDFIRRKIREVVEDPATADALSPQHTVGCKRLCVEDGYYETFNRQNVRLVDVSKKPIERFTATGLVAGGQSWDLDIVVFATGFDAFTGAVSRMKISGRRGAELSAVWEDAGPITYLGLMVPGFPNLFMVNGPGSPSVLTNMFVSIEHHVNWIASTLAHLEKTGSVSIEPTNDCADTWMQHVSDRADTTLFRSCSSWFSGANIERKRRVFAPLIDFPPYVARCEEVVANGYEGFVIS